MLPSLKLTGLPLNKVELLNYVNFNKLMPEAI